jgi:methylenetetrahydrofolate dehydrogenase (NADP+)/methenyltetrahydrofolate cyclohydrolase
MAHVIDGRALAQELRETVKREAQALAPRLGCEPALATVLVGDDAASQAYVRNKRIAAKQAGIRSVTEHLPADAPQADLLAVIDRLNADPTVHGVLVQQPLPARIDIEEVVRRTQPLKDVDTFHPENIGLLFRGAPRFLPCTPAAVVKILSSIPVELNGKHATIVGRSLIVGKPLAFLLLGRDMTVTVCHSRTTNLPEMVGLADVVVAAAGQPGLIRGDWIRKGAIVVDVGIRAGPEGKLVGDVDFEGASRRAAYITPVPGGVGPLTVACLLENVVRAAQLQLSG